MLPIKAVTFDWKIENFSAGSLKFMREIGYESKQFNVGGTDGKTHTLKLSLVVKQLPKLTK